MEKGAKRFEEIEEEERYNEHRETLMSPKIKLRELY